MDRYASGSCGELLLMCKLNSKKIRGGGFTKGGFIGGSFLGGIDRGKFDQEYSSGWDFPNIMRQTHIQKQQQCNSVVFL